MAASPSPRAAAAVGAGGGGAAAVPINDHGDPDPRSDSSDDEDGFSGFTLEDHENAMRQLRDEFACVKQRQYEKQKGRIASRIQGLRDGTDPDFQREAAAIDARWHTVIQRRALVKDKQIAATECMRLGLEQAARQNFEENKRLLVDVLMQRLSLERQLAEIDQFRLWETKGWNLLPPEPKRRSPSPVSRGHRPHPGDGAHRSADASRKAGGGSRRDAARQAARQQQALQAGYPHPLPPHPHGHAPAAQQQPAPSHKKKRKRNPTQVSLAPPIVYQLSDLKISQDMRLFKKALRAS